MKIWIAGASGLVGNNCHRYFTQQGWTVLGTHLNYATPHTQYFNTLHLADAKNADIDSFAPNIILHCGALTNVDYCETHAEESFQQTVVSTQQLVSLAKQYQALFIYLSTDYVFDGTQGPYTETAPTNPLSIYGQHKLQAEQIVTNQTNRHLILRITNVYGKEERNKNFVNRLVQAALENKHLTLKLPIDQYSTSINAADVARAIYVLIGQQQRGLFHIASTDYFNRAELAHKVLQYFPTYQNYTMEYLSTQQLNQPAPRPLQSGFLKSKFTSLFPNFMFTNVDDYLKQVLKNGL